MSQQNNMQLHKIGAVKLSSLNPYIWPVIKLNLAIAASSCIYSGQDILKDMKHIIISILLDSI